MRKEMPDSRRKPLGHNNKFVKVRGMRKQIPDTRRRADLTIRTITNPSQRKTVAISLSENCQLTDAETKIPFITGKKPSHCVLGERCIITPY